MSITGTVQRGSVVWMNLHPTRGHEQHGWRPAIVLSDGLIDPYNSSFAMVVPVTSETKGYPFEVSVPTGISLTHPTYTALKGVVLTDQAKSLDLSARNAEVIGRVDPTSTFYQNIVTNVRSILA